METPVEIAKRIAERSDYNLRSLKDYWANDGKELARGLLEISKISPYAAALRETIYRFDQEKKNGS